jgi:hypothetical protein
LEARTTPTAFTWAAFGGNTNNWEDGFNWLPQGLAQAVNLYPGMNGANNPTTNDTATIPVGFAANRQLIMTAAHEIASLTMSGAGTLTLNQQLTLNNGGTISSGTIIQRRDTANGPIVVTGGTLTWSGGNLNYSATLTTSTGNLTIQQGASAVFNAAGAVSIGDDVVNNGSLTLANSGGPATITLVNRPRITNNGSIYITGGGQNVGGLAVANGDSPVTIQNSGGITKSGNAEYAIGEPVNNMVAATLTVLAGQLDITAADSTTGYGVYQSGGVVQVNGGATLNVTSGIDIVGGDLWGAGTGTATVSGGDVRIDGGRLVVGSTSVPSATLNISGNLNFNAGTMQFYYSLTNGTFSTLNTYGLGGITINPSGTTVAETFLGKGMMPNSIAVMRARGAASTISDLAENNPDGTTASLTATIRPDDTYLLTTARG